MNISFLKQKVEAIVAKPKHDLTKVERNYVSKFIEEMKKYKQNMETEYGLR